ncbi:MAG: glycosyltransferase family 2 protein, partial [Candidatus Woesearchaeota archaeon]
YGNAYLRGFEESRGKYIVMGDSDNTYDFSEVTKFIEPLRNGYDFVIGSRLKGNILPGAMPWLHRYIGNPVLSRILRFMFHTNISDSHCGMRAFTKEAYQKMRLQTTGMEFASEMVINAARTKLKIKEIPIIYYPREGESKLHSFRDGWRHLSFMLIQSPTHLFFLPGLILILLGLITAGIVASNILYPLLGPITFILGTLLILLGYQLWLFGAIAKIYLTVNEFEPPKKFTKFLVDKISVERGILLGMIIFIIGFITNVKILIYWLNINMGALTFNEIYLALTASALIIIGIQTIFAAFIINLVKVKRRTT